MGRPHNFRLEIKLHPVQWKPGDLMKASEIAEICNVKLETVERWRVQGLIQFVVLPSGDYRYPRNEFLNLITPRQNKKKGQTAAKPNTPFLITQTLQDDK